MTENLLPTEVELAYELMPCQAMRTAQEPGATPHPCTYFRQWGRYHSYGYESSGSPPRPGVVQLTQYLGRGPLAPEMASGCRKAPIMAVGINPNLPGWWPASRNWINPLFDDCRQYAHYFRYRTTAKLDIPLDRYEEYLHGQPDGPFADTELDVPTDANGFRTIPVELQAVTMYQNYQALLDDLAKAMGWHGHELSVGEDVSYGNMVACPSAKWINRPDPANPTMPAMTAEQQSGVVSECFHHRRYFLRQLFQSLPAVLMVFSQSTTDAFVAEMAGRFTAGDPKPGDAIDVLLEREVRLRFGDDGRGREIEARVIFSPHITGDPAHFGQARAKVLEQLTAEARAGRLQLNPQTGRLRRPPGACVFCPMLDIGPCDYAAELQPLSGVPALTDDSPLPHLLAEKRIQLSMLESVPGGAAKGKRARPKAKSAKPHGAARAAAGPVAAAVGAAADAASVGWRLAGDPARQADRQPPAAKPARARKKNKS